MSLKTIIVLYKEKESKISLNLEEITSYSLLKQKILSFYNELNTPFTYHLMAINTSNPYTLLEEDNFNQIINEKIEGDDLKLFLNKIIPEEINNIDNYDNNEEKDEDFIIDNSEENKEENKDNNLNNLNINDMGNNEEIDKQLKINENFNIINDDKDNKENTNNEEDLFNQTDEIMKKIDKLIGNDDDFELLKHSKTLDKKKENFNNFNKNYSDNKASGININDEENEIIAPFPFSRKNQNLNIININNDNENNKINFINENFLNSKISNPNIFKSSICSICKSQLSDIKYICSVCDKCILCKDCEKDHYHPCFKLKTNFLGSKIDIYKFISRFYSFKANNTKNFFTKLFTKEYEIKFFPLSDKKICLRPNKNFIFPIKIINYSNNVINSTNFEIISKNNKIIRIINQNSKKFSINPNANCVFKLKCKTKKNLTKEKVEFYLFSDNLCFKSTEGLNFNVEFEINEDWDEEQMNLNFEYNEYAVLYNKEHKKMAMELLNNSGNKIWNRDLIKNVFDILVKCNWDKNIAINKIKDLKSEI